MGLTPDDPFVYGTNAATQPYPEKMGLNQIGGAKAAHALYQDEKVGTILKNKAVEWMKKQKEKPFFLYYATTNIHHPFTPAPQFKGTSKAGRYGDFMHELDWIVGEVLNTLKEQGVEDNTLVIFTSDNGGMLNQGGQEAWKLGHQLNGELLGFKFDAWEGGHRIPFIVKWPGKVQASTLSDVLISNVDLMRTLAEIVQQPLTLKDAKDSYNFLPALLGSKKEIRNELVISPWSESHISLRKGKWMYIGAKKNGGFNGQKIGSHSLGGPAAHKLTNQVNSEIEDGKLKNTAAQEQLYDLEIDPFQKKNSYHTYPDIVAEMKAELNKIINSERTAPSN